MGAKDRAAVAVDQQSRSAPRQFVRTGWAFGWSRGSNGPTRRSNIRWGNKYWRDPETRLGATPDAFIARPDRDGPGTLQIKTVSEDAWRQQSMDPDTH